MRRQQPASVLLPAIAVMMAVMMTISPVTGSESCGESLTPQTVILDRFVARDAAVADVLEALTLRVEKVTKRAYRPNLVIAHDVIRAMKVSLDLTKAPLSDALDRIDELHGVRVTYRSNQTVVFSLEQG
jgi:hypothetical protein